MSLLAADPLASPKRHAALGGAAVDFSLAPTGYIADLAVAVADRD